MVLYRYILDYYFSGVDEAAEVEHPSFFQHKGNNTVLAVVVVIVFVFFVIAMCVFRKNYRKYKQGRVCPAGTGSTPNAGIPFGMNPEDIGIAAFYTSRCNPDASINNPNDMTPMLDGGGLQPIKTQSDQDDDQNSTISENRKLIEENRKLIEKLGENFEGNQVIEMNDLP